MTKICLNCEKPFPSKLKLDGVTKNLQNRKYCFTCSPYKQHNTRPIKPKETGRVCKDCRHRFDLTTENFYKLSGKFTYYCKKCFNKYNEQRATNNKRKLVESFGGRCSICGYNKHYGALEFHHLDPAQKAFTISRKRGLSYKTLEEECKKCVLLCSNCHKEVEAGITNLPV